MRKHQTAALACRVIAVFALSRMVLLIGGHASMLQFGLCMLQGEGGPVGKVATILYLLTTVVLMAAPGVLGVLLWRYADRLAGRMAAARQDDLPTEDTGPAESFQIAAFSVLALYILADVVPKTIHTAVTFGRDIQTGGMTPRQRWTIVLLVCHAMAFGIAVCLLLGWRRVIQLLKKLRSRGWESAGADGPSSGETRKR